MNKKNTFVHLRVRTSYSLLEGAISISELVEISSKLNYPAVGITDRGNLFGALEASEAFAEKGIQPIIGCQLNLEFSKQKDSEKSQRAYIVLLAKSEVGYKNLMKLDRYYRTLGVTGTEDTKVIKQAFMRVAQKYHPDKNDGNERAASRFMQLTRSYKQLMGQEAWDSMVNEVRQDEESEDEATLSDIEEDEFYEQQRKIEDEIIEHELLIVLNSPLLHFIFEDC